MIGEAEAADGEALPYLLDDQVGFLLRQVQQRHAGIFASAFGDAFTPMQWAVVAKLAEVGACSQNLLGRLVSMDVATVKGVVERLERRGLVDIRPDPDDRRRVILELGPAGLDVYRENVGRARRVSEDTLAPLDERDRRVLIALLRRMG